MEVVERGIVLARNVLRKERYGGAELNTVKELKALKEENGKLKKLVADLSLDKVALKELLEGKW